MSTSCEARPACLEGYELVARLGTGGYGEVWRASVSGGLSKAVKFIYGDSQAQRAEHELRALRRIRDVRHPFVLSIDRVEAVEGRLAVVMELAEGSLRDRFNACLAEGLPGVPQAEMLSYLRDAAEALDYLALRHALQHLDVKPENLLVVGGHVKVADFGMVKELGAPQASLVGGLTPLYTAPEVFRGTPAVQSDQYSLAVLYVELVAGRPPFSHGSPAELTLQHLQASPDLSGVPLEQRFPLARALAKEPEQRYGTCGEFIADLTAAAGDAGGKSDAWRQGERASAESEQQDPGEGTTAGEGRQARSFAAGGPAAVSQPTIQWGACDWEEAECSEQDSAPQLFAVSAPADPSVRRHVFPDRPRADAPVAPVLLVGVGGVGAAVLRRVRELAAARFGVETALPTMQLLLLDTDRQALGEAMRGAPESALRSEETLALPLRRPQEYRDRVPGLGWLGRRWLYNVPRSLRTEGLRPLGRLAFWDHARQFAQRVRLAATAAQDAEGMREAASKTGLAFESGKLKVMVVASISGGTGSGLTLDLGYGLRHALAKAGADIAGVTGLFIHAASGDSRRADLARVNAFAWLTEYQHFNQSDVGFPGDSTCGLPAFPAGVAAYDHAYLLDWGQIRESESFAEHTAAVAEYLMLDAFTPAGSFIDACRKAPPTGGASRGTLRTVQIERVEVRRDAARLALVRALCRRVIRNWMGNGPQTPWKSHGVSAVERPAEVEQLAAGGYVETGQFLPNGISLINRLRLHLEGMASNARRILELQFEPDCAGFLADLRKRLNDRREPASLRKICSMVDAVFAPPSGVPEGQEAYLGNRQVATIISPLATKLAGDIERWVLGLLDDSEERLAGAQRAASWLISRLEVVEHDACRLKHALSRQVAEFFRPERTAGSPFAPTEGEELAEALGAYFRLRLDEAAVHGAACLARRTKNQLRSLEEALVEYGRQIQRLGESFKASAEEMSESLLDGSESSRLASRICDELLSRQGEDLASDVEQRVQNFVTSMGGLFQSVIGNAQSQKKVVDELRRLAEDRVRPLLAAIQGLDGLATAEALREVADRLREQPQGEPSGMLAHGADIAGMLVAPSCAAQLVVDEGPLSDFSDRATLESCGPVVLACTEVWNLSVPRVALDLIGRRQDLAELSKRVRTRKDVGWSDLEASVVEQATKLPVAAAQA